MGKVRNIGGGKQRTPKQETLPAPGMARTHHVDIEGAADSFQEAEAEAKELRDAAKHRMGVLRAAMAKHKLDLYRLDDGRVVRVKAGEDKVRVEKVKKPRGRRREIPAVR